MTIPPDKQKIKDYLRCLGNPYAFAEGAVDWEIAGSSVVTSVEPHHLTPAQRSYVKKTGNPYAALAFGDESDKADSQQSAFEYTDNPKPSAKKQTASRAEFESECRRILRQYIPAIEGGRLRPHHRAFITRNASSAPVRRRLLLNELRKYDLSSVQGLRAHFNREQESLTDAKLKELERIADSKK